MWWRLLVTGLLLAVLVLLVRDPGRIERLLPDGRTPHEAYQAGLEAAGLADTALARDWVAAAGRALRKPRRATLPLVVTLDHAASRPDAYGYQLELERGRVLNVALTVDGPQPPRVFIDLFRLPEDGTPEPVASAEGDALGLTHEIRRDGTYIVRIQPELLRGGALRIEHRTTASLTFPVAGRDVTAVRSYFGDPRDAGRRAHHGVDIFAPRDTPVLAAAPGFVSSVGTSRLGGNVVWVWDMHRRQSHYYAHLSRQAVRTGERVRAGDVVGYVGNSGNARSTPPHLHFGIYALREGPIDPLPFVSGGRGPQPPEAGPGRSGAKPGQASTGSGG